MAECIILKGGGGADLDVVTAGKPDVLAGKVIVGPDGEPLTGTMPNNGAVSQTLNAGGSYTVPGGYHNGSGKVTANNLASQTGATATAAHILSGQTAWVNGSKVSGGIPWQNAETDGDRVWATQASNWAGTFNIGVRNGHYLNGVNWIRYDVPNYQPWNIKKDVNIGGVVGTWEGYVPTPTDLYLRGNNIAGWVKGGGGGSSYVITFETGQISVGAMAAGGYLTTNNPVNLTGYNGIAVEGYRPGSATTITIQLATANGAFAQTDGGIARADTAVGDNSNFTAYCNVSTINAARYIHINAINASFYVYRIWLY